MFGFEPVLCAGWYCTLFKRAWEGDEAWGGENAEVFEDKCRVFSNQFHGMTNSEKSGHSRLEVNESKIRGRTHPGHPCIKCQR